MGISDLQVKSTSTLKNAENIARLRDLKPRQRIQRGEHAFFLHLVGTGRRPGLQPQRSAVHAIRLPELRPLERDRTVVVKRGAPKHRSVTHHAAGNASLLDRVALATTGSSRHAQIAGIYEAHELQALAFEKGVGSFGIGARAFAVALPFIGKTRLHVGREFDLFNFF